MRRKKVQKKKMFSGDWKLSCVCVACGARYKLWFPHSVGVRVDMDSDKRYNHNADPPIRGTKGDLATIKTTAVTFC